MIKEHWRLLYIHNDSQYVGVIEHPERGAAHRQAQIINNDPGGFVIRAVAVLHIKPKAA